MTTVWHPSGNWSGETVAVLGTGPSLTPEAVALLREHRTIAVNFACRLAPDADMLVALDGNWPQEFREFKGMRVTAVADDDLDALYVGPQWERVKIGAGHEIEIHNSGLAAIRIAVGMGAGRIILAGFDAEDARHFYDDEVDTGGYVGLAQALSALVTELSARGFIVERFQLEDERV
jgi:hypothetical protein